MNLKEAKRSNDKDLKYHFHDLKNMQHYRNTNLPISASPKLVILQTMDWNDRMSLNLLDTIKQL